MLDHNEAFRLNYSKGENKSITKERNIFCIQNIHGMYFYGVHKDFLFHHGERFFIDSDRFSSELCKILSILQGIVKLRNKEIQYYL